jgi:hypothetical protein
MIESFPYDKFGSSLTYHPSFPVPLPFFLFFHFQKKYIKSATFISTSERKYRLVYKRERYI